MSGWWVGGETLADEAGPAVEDVVVKSIHLLRSLPSAQAKREGQSVEAAVATTTVVETETAETRISPSPAASLQSLGGGGEEAMVGVELWPMVSDMWERLELRSTPSFPGLRRSASSPSARRSASSLPCPQRSFSAEQLRAAAAARHSRLRHVSPVPVVSSSSAATPAMAEQILLITIPPSATHQILNIRFSLPPHAKLCIQP